MGNAGPSSTPGARSSLETKLKLVTAKWARTTVQGEAVKGLGFRVLGPFRGLGFRVLGPFRGLGFRVSGPFRGLGFRV